MGSLVTKSGQDARTPNGTSYPPLRTKALFPSHEGTCIVRRPNGDSQFPSDGGAGVGL